MEIRSKIAGYHGHFSAHRMVYRIAAPGDLSADDLIGFGDKDAAAKRINNAKNAGRDIAASVGKPVYTPPSMEGIRFDKPSAIGTSVRKLVVKVFARVKTSVSNAMRF